MKKSYFKSKLSLLAFLMCLGISVQAQKAKEIQQIRKSSNLTELGRLEKQLKTTAEKEKKQALRLAKQNGWKTKFTTKDGRFLELQKVVDGKPIYYSTFNVDAAKSTRTNHLNAGGSLGLNLMGQGLTAHVWDGGKARVTHQEYDGAGGNNRYSVGDRASVNSHAAHVTGTIMASGVRARAKGMAPHAKVRGFDWNSDKSEATTAASNGMLVSNHSYGYPMRNNNGQVALPQYHFGGYIADSRDWDKIMFNAPYYLMVVAAGNDGRDDTAVQNPTGGYGFDKLNGQATSKNNLVVANAEDASVSANGDLISVTINSSSSEGPTNDFRIKPDITGNGTGVYSTYEKSDSDYASITGTSMASPNVTGSLLLLQQHYNNLNGEFMRSATLKGLALHTADDAGVSGPDAIFGWGLLNAKRAAEAISNNENGSKIEELTLNSGQSYTITVESDGTSPLLASISWTDRPGTAVTSESSARVLVNDLDIRVTKGSTTYLPYKLTGGNSNARRDNNVDPFERIDVSNASGTYTITVTNKGSLVGGSQNYSLIVTGITGTPVNCVATVPTDVQVNGIAGTSANVSWANVAGATYDVRYRQTGTTSWNTVSSDRNSTTINRLTESTDYEVEVRSKCSEGGNSDYSRSVRFTTTDGNNDPDTTAPTAPRDLTASNVTETTVNLSWAASRDNIGVTGYNVYLDGELLGTTENTEASLQQLAENTSYSVYIEAYDAAGNVSEASNTVRFTTGDNGGGGGGDSQAPTAPSSIGGRRLSSSSVYVYWGASSDNVGVTGYNVYLNGNKLGTVNRTSATISQLYGSQYSVNITAVDAAGNESAASQTLTIYNSYSGRSGFAENAQASLTDGDGSFSIYPNPAKDLININGLYNANYKIVDLVGKVIKSGKANGNEINVSDLTSGIYLIEATDGDNTFSSKFVKN